MESRLRLGLLFCNTPPTRVTVSSCAVAASAIAHELNVGEVIIRRPVPLKIFEECRPIVRQVVFVEILYREGKAVIDPATCVGAVEDIEAEHTSEPTDLGFERSE